MEKIKIRITVEALVLSGAVSLIFFWQGKSFIGSGILVGVFTGIISFWLLTRHISRSVSLNPKKIKPYFFLKYLARYVIMGTVLFSCAKIDLKFFFGTAGGLLLIYIVIFLDAYQKIRPKRKICKIQQR